MLTANVEPELDALLSIDADGASPLAFAAMNDGDWSRLVLYGAGTLGREVLRRMRRAGREPLAFADDTPGKQGLTLDGVRITTPAKAVEEFGSNVVFVVTILNPMLCFLEAKSRLEKDTGACVISFLHLAWKYPFAFLPYCQFERPQSILLKAHEIQGALELFADDESRRQFVAHMRFRLLLDFDALPPSSGDNYFPANVPLDLPAETTFVDCGAYDGDSLRHFLAHQRGLFREIYAFEPDVSNCARLRKYVNSLGHEMADRVHVFNAGVGERREKLRFQATGTMSAAINELGSVQVEVLPLDEVLKQTSGAVYLKFDVEGAEWEALRGAERLLRGVRPRLAISVYHRPYDLWQLPLYVHGLGLGYRLFLRTQGYDGTDVICYAISR